MLNKIHIRKLCAGARVFLSPFVPAATRDRVDQEHLAMYVGTFVTRLGCNTRERGCMVSRKGHKHLSKLCPRECMLCGTCDPPEVPLIYPHVWLPRQVTTNTVYETRQKQSYPGFTPATSVTGVGLKGDRLQKCFTQKLPKTCQMMVCGTHYVLDYCFMSYFYLFQNVFFWGTPD